MQRDENWQKLESLAQEISEREGCVLYHMDLVGSSQARKLRVFIDKAKALTESDHVGATLGDCESVSKALSLVLDIEDLVAGEGYHLEVSTPGLERVLVRPWHFKQALGKIINLKLSRGLENRKGLKSFKAELLDVVEDGEIKVKIKEQEELIPFEDILKANIVYSFPKNPKQKN